MRRIFLLLSLIALAVGFQACAADAPAPTPPGGSGSTANSALQVRVFTNNANPTAGFCSTIQAIVTLNGANVPDGTGVIFSTDFGTFQQNGQALVSVVTGNGTALTAVCSSFVGVAKVKASVTIGTRTASASIGISFQPSAQAVPFFAFCSPSSGPNTGGTSLTITGGRFFGDATTTRVQFTAFGITREGVVQAVTATTLTVLTPAFPEAASPSVPVDIAVTFGTNTGAPITLAVPNCFVYGTASSDQPTITAVLPSTGSNDGGTRVTIIGSGFIPPLQVFFGTVESAPPISVTFNQIVVLAPAATPQSGQVNANVTIRVHNVTSGKDGSLAGAFTYVTKILITGWTNNVQSVEGPFTPVTIFGQGFSSPVAVSLAGFGATIISVSSTELVVIPGPVLVNGCNDITGTILVVSINSGDFDEKGSFTYLVKAAGPVISSVSASESGGTVTAIITGANFSSIASVTVGGKSASFSVSSSGQITATASGFVRPTCPTGSLAGTLVSVGDVAVTNSFGCTATKTGGLALGCVLPPPTPTPTTP
jgi:hypothetical protein